MLLLVYFCFWFPFGYKRWTHSFRPSKCLVQAPFNPKWEIEPLDSETKENVLAILGKPFTYLSKGAQSYVFLSHDQNYVLKLFRYDTCKIPFGQIFVRRMRKWVGAREKHFLTTEFKVEKNFSSCKLAYDLAQKQTGIIFAHLNPKKDFLPVFTLKDRIGRSYRIDPAQYRFVLQKKIEPFGSILKCQEIEPYIDSYMRLLDEIAALGLVNLDVKLGGNFGFLDGNAVVIDFGNFLYSSELAREQEKWFVHRFNGWLEKKSLLLPKAESCENR